MNEVPNILHIELGHQSIQNWIKKNRYVIFSELIRFSERLITDDLDFIQSIMISNTYDNIVFIIKKQNIKDTLNKAMEYFMQIEEYEQCARIRDLLILIENHKNETKSIKINKSNQR